MMNIGCLCLLSVMLVIVTGCNNDAKKSNQQPLPVEGKGQKGAQIGKPLLVDENGDYTFSAQDFGLQPLSDNQFTSVVIDAFVPGSSKGSTLRLGGKAVEPQQVIPVPHLPFLVFTPGVNDNGRNAARIQYQIEDVNGFRGRQRYLSFSVRARGADGEVSISENSRYTLNMRDLGFQSHGQEDKQHVIIHDITHSANKKGQWLYNMQPLDLNMPRVIPVTHLDQVVFIPESGMSGKDYTRLLFSVDDESFGTHHVDDASRKMLTVHVKPIPHKPGAQDTTLVVDENREYRFKPDDFGFSAVDAGNVLKSVAFKHITYAKPGREVDGQTIKPGELFLGVDAVDRGKPVLADTIPLLRFVPDTNRNGKGYATLGFSVTDDRGLSSDEKTLTMDVRPIGVDGWVVVSGGQTVTLSLEDFGFEMDHPDDDAITVTLASLPVSQHIEIQLRASPVQEGQVIAAKDIDAGFLQVVYKGATSDNMIHHYEGLQFTVNDERIASTGHQPVIKTLTIHVVHHHKRHHHRHGVIVHEDGVNRIVKTVSDSHDSHAMYGFSPEDFLFAGSNEETLKAVVITQIIFDPRGQKGDFFLGRDRIAVDKLTGMQLLKDEISFLYFVPKPPFMHADDPFVTVKFYSDDWADQTNIHEHQLDLYLVPQQSP